METFNHRSASLFLVLLICGDLAFVVLHFIMLFLRLENSPLSLEMDKGYSEIYQYLKYFWITIILILVSLKEASLNYIAWVLVFVYFLFDDSLQIHERVGSYIAANLSFMPILGLRLQDFGELIVSAAAGIILLLPLVLAYKHGTRKFQKISRDFALLILVLIFFSVVIDMVHIAIKLGWEVTFILGVIEESGEMLSVSLILWYVFLVMVRDCDPGCYLYEYAATLLTRRSIKADKF